MPIEVEGPDGVTIEFPDGTPPATIQGAMRKRYGGPAAPAPAPAKRPLLAGAPTRPLAGTGGDKPRGLGDMLATTADQMFRTYGGAAADALDAASGLINNPVNAVLDAAGVDFKFPTRQVGPRVAQPEGAIPQLTRGVAPYLAGATALPKAAAAVSPKIAAAFSSMPIRADIAAGAVVDSAMSSVSDANLSNLLEDTTGYEMPLARRPGENAGIAGLKDIAEGGLLGGAVGGVIRFFTRGPAAAPGTPEAAAERAEAEAALQDPAIRDQLRAMGVDPDGMTPGGRSFADVLEGRRAREAAGADPQSVIQAAVRGEAPLATPGVTLEMEGNPAAGAFRQDETGAWVPIQEDIAARLEALRTAPNMPPTTRADIEAVQAGTADPATIRAPQRQPLPDAIAVDAAGRADVGDTAIRTGEQLRRPSNLPVPVDAPTPRMSDEQIAQAQAANRGGSPNPIPERDPMAAPEGRLPQTRDDIAAQRDAEGAFDLAARQDARVTDGVRDTQTAGLPDGPQPQRVLMDEGFPVKVVNDLGNGKVEVQRYDPRTGEIDPEGVPYRTTMAGLSARNYTPEPRRAQDFTGRAGDPAKSPETPRADPNGNGRGASPDPTRTGGGREPVRTYQATEPDPNTQLPGAGPEARSPNPDQPDGPYPFKPDAPRGERAQRAQTEEELRARYERARADQQYQEAQARARESYKGQDAKSSNTAKAPDAESRFETDEFGFVRSDKGGPLRFGDQKQATKWILNVGNKTSPDQVFEIANGPKGGFTVRETGRAEAPAGAKAGGEDAVNPPSPPRSGPEGPEGVTPVKNAPAEGAPATAAPARSETPAESVGRQEGLSDAPPPRAPEEPAARNSPDPASLPPPAGRNSSEAADDFGAAVSRAEDLQDNPAAARAHIAEDVSAFAAKNQVRAEFNTEARVGLRDEQLELTDLYADVPGGGAGTKVMQRLAALADAAQVTVWLKPENPRNPPFYSRFGFEREGNGWWRRSPEYKGDTDDFSFDAEAVYNRSFGKDAKPIKGAPTAPKPKPGRGTKLYSNPIGEKVVEAIERAVKGEIDGFKADLSGIRRDLAGLKNSVSGPAVLDTLGHVVRKVWWSNVAAIRSLAAKYPDVPEIKQLADLIGTDPGRGRLVGQTFERAYQTEAMGKTNQVFNILGAKFDAKFEARVTDILAGRKRAVSGSREADVARRLRTLLDKQHDYMTKAGLEPGYVKGSYYPRVLDEEAVLKDPTGFMAKAEQVYRRMGLSPEASKEAASEWMDRVRGITDGAYAQGTPASKHTQGRTLPADADRILDGFYEKDPRANLAAYLRQTSRAAEFARRFGKNGEKVEALFNEMIRKSVDEGDVTSMKHQFESAVGTLYSTRPDKAASALSWIQTAGVLRLLPRAVISSMVEGLAVGVRAHDVGSGFKAMVDSYAILTKLDDAADVRQTAEFLGIVGDAMNDLVLQAGFGGEVSGQLQQKILARFFRTTYLHQLTEAQRLAALRVGQGMVRTLLQDVAQKTSRQASAKRLLTELGISDPAKVAAWLERSGKVMDETAEAGEYRTALQRFVDESIQNPTAADRPQWANHPFGRLAYGITSFMFSFTRNVILRSAREGGEGMFGKGYTPADRIRLISPMVGLAALTVAQGQVSDMRELLLNPEAKDERTWKQKVILNLSRAGAFGNADPFVNIAMSARYNRDLTSTLTGPYLTAYLDSLSKMTVGLVPKELGGPNTSSTNNAEWQASKAAYEAIAAPVIAAGTSYLPGGPLLRAGYGAGIITATAPGAAREVANAVAGERKIKPKAKAEDTEMPDLLPKIHLDMLNGTSSRDPVVGDSDKLMDDAA